MANKKPDKVKPKMFGKYQGNGIIEDIYYCPNCFTMLFGNPNQCPKCKTKLNWELQDGKEKT